MPRCHSLLPHADEGAGAFLVVSGGAGGGGGGEETGFHWEHSTNGGDDVTRRPEFVRGRRESALRDDWQSRRVSSPNHGLTLSVKWSHYLYIDFPDGDEL